MFGVFAATSVAENRLTAELKRSVLLGVIDSLLERKRAARSNWYSWVGTGLPPLKN
jgi:hypothetical protein